MPLMRSKRVIPSLGALLALATLLTPALSKSQMAAPGSSLAGQLLIASPEIGDPRFYHAVILMVQHNQDGALGVIINRPIEERSLASLMDAIGENDTGVVGNVRIFAGGPVEPRIGFVVHSSEYHRAETMDIDDHVSMTSSPQILRDIGHDQGPKKSLVAFGYTGWGPGQLEGELARRGWFTAPGDPKLIFDEDREKVWEDAMASRTLPV